MEESESESVIFQLVYASAAAVDFKEEELEVLLARARENNAGLGVTGILLYHEGSFLQTLEGEQDVVERLYGTILNDPRHCDHLLLYRTQVEARIFEDWSMGFHRLPKSAARELPGLSEFLRTGVAGLSAADGEKIRDILAGFREGKWRRQVDSGRKKPKKPEKP